MNDTIQIAIRAALNGVAGWLVTKGYADKETADYASAGGIAFITIIWAIAHHQCAKNPTPPPSSGSGSIAGSAPCVLALVLGWTAFFVTGCSSSSICEERLDTNGVKYVTEFKVRTLFDSQTALAKLRTANTPHGQGVGVESFDAQSTGSNAVTVSGNFTKGIEAIGAMLH